mmetsp:Transcript_6215/g.27393  ORF Transcript_6215/g.27393 Transcript_6215/m.27393 type:complete len:227 (+) Transcript_6215:187-867(+)
MVTGTDVSTISSTWSSSSSERIVVPPSTYTRLVNPVFPNAFNASDGDCAVTVTLLESNSGTSFCVIVRLTTITRLPSYGHGTLSLATNSATWSNVRRPITTASTVFRNAPKPKSSSPSGWGKKSSEPSGLAMYPSIVTPMYTTVSGRGADMYAAVAAASRSSAEERIKSCRPPLRNWRRPLVSPLSSLLSEGRPNRFFPSPRLALLRGSSAWCGLPMRLLGTTLFR